MKKEKGFIRFIENEAGAGLNIRDILNKWDIDSIVKCVEDYAQNKNKNMKRLKFETKQQLDFFVLNYLVQVNEVEIQEINDPMDFSVADIAEEISDFLVVHGFARVDEIEEFECPEGCTGCDQPKQ